MQPSHLKYFEWNWWHQDHDKRLYYKNDVTFHGPQIYLSGPIYNSPYPSLMASNFDSIDFEYPLKYLTCRLAENNHNIQLMTDYVTDILEQDIMSHDDNRCGGNRFSRHHHHHHSRRHCHNNDEEFQQDIKESRVRFSVKGVFISKPYNEGSFNSDGSFDINLHCHWNIDCIESEAAYNVIILPSSHKNRKRHKELECKDDGYISTIDTDNKDGVLRIYPQQSTQHQPHHQQQQQQQYINHGNSRKRSRSQLEESHDEDMLNDLQSLNVMPSAIPMKRRKLSINQCKKIDGGYNNEEKQELEHKSADCEMINNSIPLQQKKLVHKSSNRKPHKTIHRHNGRVSVTMDKKLPLRFRKNRTNNHNNYNNHNKHNNQENNNDKSKSKIDCDGKYRGYFIALFVPRFQEFSSLNYWETASSLQPFIRGQIVFYDSIHVDQGQGEEQGKPQKENYQWLMENIVKTYKKKGKNITEFQIMRKECEKYIQQQYRNTINNNHNHNHNHDQNENESKNDNDQPMTNNTESNGSNESIVFDSNTSNHNNQSHNNDNNNNISNQEEKEQKDNNHNNVAEQIANEVLNEAQDEIVEVEQEEEEEEEGNIINITGDDDDNNQHCPNSLSPQAPDSATEALGTETEKNQN